MDDARENLAEELFNLWAGWLWVFIGKGKFRQDGDLLIPARFINRWYQMLGSSYKNLVDTDKDMFRNDADKVLELVSHE